MPLINLSVKHGSSQDEAKGALAAAVTDVRGKFGPAVRGETWSPDRSSVTLTGPGVVVELRIDAENVHATGDIPLLGNLLGTGFGQRLTAGLKGALGRHFKGLPQEK